MRNKSRSWGRDHRHLSPPVRFMPEENWCELKGKTDLRRNMDGDELALAGQK